ncbi:MAG: methyltransferase domain-containing protein [Simkaniaceae bacterium]|nr:MAG: methyltransferase domain-containing protein [Simkaniaceae bacterium]
MSKTLDKIQNKHLDANSTARAHSKLNCLGPIADLEKHLPREWWRDLFNSLYLKTDADVIENAENTKNDIDMLIKATGITPSQKILDLCCGQGRHTLELAKRGYSYVSGIDRSRYLIRLARKRGNSMGLSRIPKFSEGDARKIRVSSNSLDLITIMGNSFGYFEHEDDDLKVLKEVNRALSSQGMIYLDVTNGEWVKQNYQPRSWEWIDQSLFVCRERHLSEDKKRLICREVIVEVEKGVIADQFYAERLFSYADLHQLLEKAGFETIEYLENVQSLSTREQDLGMMAHRMILKALAPIKAVSIKKKNSKKISCTVLLGDPSIPDAVKKDGKFNEEDLNTIQKLKNALSKLPDFHFTYMDDHPALIKSLIKSPPDLVFNLCDEGFNNKATQELHICALLEMLNIPYTGAGPTCLAFSYDKALTRAIAQSLEIPVPDEIWIDPNNASAALPNQFPALLKPALGDSSIGITQKAVVHNAEELIDYFDWLKTTLPNIPVLIQEFLSGEEYSVGVIGNDSDFQILPILEVDYSHLPKELPRLLPYESKWLPDSDYWKTLRYKGAELTEDEQRAISDYSIQLFERMGCRDYARFDFRKDSKGQIKLLEVNPNPGWCWDGKFNYMAEFAGMSYVELLQKILMASLERLKF